MNLKANSLLLRWTAAALLAVGASAMARAAEPPTIVTPLVLPPPAPAPSPLQTQAQALAQDAAEYARHYDVPLDAAIRRLRAQQETVAATDRLRDIWRDRLAGIFIEHRPDYRIVVLLTGDEPVPDDHVAAGGMDVPIVFRTGALATRDQVVAAIAAHQAEIRAALPHPPGLGADPKSGAMVVMLTGANDDPDGPDALAARLTAIAGVPVRIRNLARPDVDLSVQGGARLEGMADGARHACTAGFVVTDGIRDAIVTAAHCPENLSYVAPDRSQVPLRFVGKWGWGYQDVQVDVADSALKPYFYADRDKILSRAVASWRNRASTRAGDFVCHRGEKTGYSCAEVELVDFAPSGDLCGGPCQPTWVAVAGPQCRPGDSGAPVFDATIAFGIVKGASYRPGGACIFYYYMSVDYLPPGWTLRHE